MPESSLESDCEHNRLHWIAEEERLSTVWDRAQNPGGQKQLEKLSRQGKKPSGN